VSGTAFLGTAFSGIGHEVSRHEVSGTSSFSASPCRSSRAVRARRPRVEARIDVGRFPGAPVIPARVVPLGRSIPLGAERTRRRLRNVGRLRSPPPATLDDEVGAKRWGGL